MARRFRLPRARIAYAHDVVMAAASFYASLYLRLGNELFHGYRSLAFDGALLFTAVAAAVLWFMRLYRGVWRYASLNDMIAIAKAVTLIMLVYLPIMFLWSRLELLPRSFLIINWFVLMAFLGGPRIAYRLFKDRRLDYVLERDGHRRVPVLLVGAGDEAELFIRAMDHPRTANYRVAGILDEKGGRVGREIHGVKVLGGIDDLEEVVRDLAARDRRPERLILTKDTLDRATVRDLLERADGLGLSMARLPRMTDFRDGESGRVEARPIALEDLLGRPQAVLDRKAMAALIAGRRVLVTGAGGTIGSELVRQIAAYGPARLTLVDHGEFNLYAIEQEVIRRAPDLARAARLVDVRDRAAVGRLFDAERPQLVFHAAALKHVPIVESQPAEGVLTNVVGTRVVADACRAAGVDVMVLISTDKAVNPSSVMGATKRVAESYCQALDIEARQRGGGTRFVTVRFGNVLGSTGSVVPLFQRQIAAGGPVTVTHPEITRYFMSVREAVELVLQASALGERERDRAGRIFVLDMGEPVRIADLARQMIRLAGRRPGVDIEIEYVGLRPGEKLHEELFHDAEAPRPTAAEGILVAEPRTAEHAVLARALDEIEEIARRGDDEAVRDLLGRLVSEYRPPTGTAAPGDPMRAFSSG